MSTLNLNCWIILRQSGVPLEEDCEKSMPSYKIYKFKHDAEFVAALKSPAKDGHPLLVRQLKVDIPID
jgi:hypothetical protein